jgi:LVIVD repeat
MGLRTGIAGLVTLTAAAVVGALAPAAAVAHPACANAATSFLSVNAGWTGGLPTGEDLAEDNCSLIDIEAALSQNISTTAAADPIDPLVPLYTKSDDMTLRGYSARNLPMTSALAGINSDLAFKGNLAFQGHWNGFRVLDVSDPANPVQVSNYEACVHPSGQGDIVVYGNILVRTWDSASNTGSLTCGGQLVGTGFEGIHIFNIADPANPVFVKQLRMAATGNDPGAPTGCGAHTATAVPDPGRDNLYLYVGASSGSCPGLDVVRIKLSDPTNAVFVRRALSGGPTQGPNRTCHDNNVIMGSVNLVMCAGGNGVSVYRFDPAIDPAAEGGIEFPTLLYSRSFGVGTGHSGSFSYDGKVLVFGHEPGGGTQAMCEAGDSILNKSLFFVDPLTGNTLGTMVHVRPQGSQENCTWHNFNVVPTYKRNIVVTGNYQSGISVVDFTDPANPQEIAFADPAPLTPSTPIVTGGDWSTYWHNGRLYESDIRRGLLVWDIDDDAINRTKTLTGDHNPQTQTSSYEQDFEPPAIDIASPVDGAEYGQGDTVLADFSCADAANAVESCVGTVADGAAVNTQGSGAHVFKVTATDVAGNVSTKEVVFNVLHTDAEQTVSGTVPGTLSLTIGPPVSFGAFTPGVAREYNASTTANVVSSAGEATLSVADASTTATGHLVNGAFSLPQTLKARAVNATNPGTTFADVGSAAAPLNLLTYGGPVSNDPVSLQFQQLIGTNDPLRTGTYSKTLTFTLSTTTP